MSELLIVNPGGSLAINDRAVNAVPGRSLAINVRTDDCSGQGACAINVRTVKGCLGGSLGSLLSKLS